MFLCEAFEILNEILEVEDPRGKALGNVLTGI